MDAGPWDTGYSFDPSVAGIDTFSEADSGTPWAVPAVDTTPSYSLGDFYTNVATPSAAGPWASGYVGATDTAGMSQPINRANSNFPISFDQSKLAGQVQDILGSVFAGATNAARGAISGKQNQSFMDALQQSAFQNFFNTKTGSQMRANAIQGQLQSWYQSPIFWVVGGLFLLFGVVWLVKR